MSVVSMLVIHPDRLPSFDAIRDAGLRTGDIDLYDPIDMTSHTGFLPVKVEGRETGFEYYFQKIEPGELPPEIMAFGTHYIATRILSSPEEGRATMIFLKIVAHLTGGLYLYPGDGLAVGPEGVAAYLDEQIAAYTAMISKQR